MRRVWHVFWREFWGHLTRRSYLIFTFGFPAFIIIMPMLGGLTLALVMASAIPPTDPRPVGLVDQGGLTAGVPDVPDRPVEIRPYPSLAEADAALDAGDIQAYYHLPPDYWQTGQVKIVYEQPPTEEIDQAVAAWLRQRVRAKVPPAVLAQLDREARIAHQNAQGESVFDLEDILAAALVFGLAYFVQLGGSFTANYMFDSVASESWDRTIEIVLTSISPMQFLVGKVLGLLGVGLTQLLTWLLVGGTIILWGSAQLGVDLAGLIFGWDYFWLIASVLLATYVTNQLLAAAIGLLHMNSGSGPLFFNTLNWVAGIGFLYAIILVPRNPNTPLAVITSMLPITAPIVLLVRLVVSEVPAWQLVVGQVIMWSINIASLFWLRHLLKTNLVAYAPRFKLWPWLRGRVAGR